MTQTRLASPQSHVCFSRPRHGGWLRVVFDKGVCTITDPKSGFCLVSKFLKDLSHGARLFRIHTAHVATTTAQLADDASLWHQHLRHIGITSLKNIRDHLDDSPPSLQNVANPSPATICTLVPMHARQADEASSSFCHLHSVNSSPPACTL